VCGIILIKAANLKAFFYHQSTDVTQNNNLKNFEMMVLLPERITMEIQQYYDRVNKQKNRINNLKLHTWNIADAGTV